jgi:hypothetical protein
MDRPLRRRTTRRLRRQRRRPPTKTLFGTIMIGPSSSSSSSSSSLSSLVGMMSSVLILIGIIICCRSTPVLGLSSERPSSKIFAIWDYEQSRLKRRSQQECHQRRKRRRQQQSFYANHFDDNDDSNDAEYAEQASSIVLLSRGGDSGENGEPIFPNNDGIGLTMDQNTPLGRRRSLPSSSMSSKQSKNYQPNKDILVDDINNNDEYDVFDCTPFTSTSIRKVQTINRVKMWPPWPINLLQERIGTAFMTGRNEDDDDDTDTHNTVKTKKKRTIGSGQKGHSTQSITSLASNGSMYPSIGAMMLEYLKHRSLVGVRQLREIGSQLWFHLPPAAPPLIILAMIPQRMMSSSSSTQMDPATGLVLSRNIFPILSNPFVRTVALCSLGVAIMSWGQQELERKRKLTPLLLSLPYYESVSKVTLPPFLPEEVYDPEMDALHSVEQALDYTNNNIDQFTKRGPHEGSNGFNPPPISSNDADGKITSSNNDNNNHNNAILFSKVPPNIRKYVDTLYENAVKPQKNFQYFYQQWTRQRDIRRKEVAKIRRMTIYDELVALQSIKRLRFKQQQQAVTGQPRMKKKTSAPVGEKSSSSSSMDERYDAGAHPTFGVRTNHNSTKNIGFALVTGASQGIGRAIAVELARWEIPLVLVARDVNKLSQLAIELQTCYGVQCCVLGADLAEIDAAEKIYEATTSAGINVDILVNNVRVHQSLSVLNGIIDYHVPFIQSAT